MGDGSLLNVLKSLWSIHIWFGTPESITHVGAVTAVRAWPES